MNLILLIEKIFSDLLGYNQKFISLDMHIKAAIDWICFASDVHRNGGVSLRYSLIKGWSSSYPETTGYIIPTLIEYSKLSKCEEHLKRAIRMAEWELSIQNSDGSFYGGALGSRYSKFVFDTGQIIFGLIAAHRVTGEEKFLKGAVKAGNWLKDVQDNDGKWSKYTFHNIRHSYYSRVAWALAELSEYVEDRTYSTAAYKNIRWVLNKKEGNGWFNNAGFIEDAHATPYTHTIAYTIRGILETGILLKNREFIDASFSSGKALHKLMRSDGSFNGTYDKNWNSKNYYSCLTGNAQISIILMKLYIIYQKKDYFEKAKSINRYLCSCQKLKGYPETRGAIAGSRPIWGKYQRFAYPNWAAKFFVDALLLEKNILLTKEISNENIVSLER